jgi:hypothetical protein
MSTKTSECCSGCGYLVLEIIPWHLPFIPNKFEEVLTFDLDICCNILKECLKSWV